MKKEYYRLRLNNARVIEDGKDIVEGCLTAKPEYNSKGKLICIKKPLLVIAEKDDKEFIDIISGKKIIFNDTFISRGNFGIMELSDTVSYEINHKYEVEQEYIDNLDILDEETLSKYDQEAEDMIIHIDNRLSCYEYKKIEPKEVVESLNLIDNQEAIEKYMEEISKIERGDIGKEKAIRYLDLRRKHLYKERNSDDSARKYINAFKSRYKKI